jgi:hypothetical protein
MSKRIISVASKLIYRCLQRKHGRNPDISETDMPLHKQSQILRLRIFYLNVFMFYLRLLSFLVLFATCHESVVGHYTKGYFYSFNTKSK